MFNERHFRIVLLHYALNCLLHGNTQKERFIIVGATVLARNPPISRPVLYAENVSRWLTNFTSDKHEDLYEG
jgi:hypothetical protein